MARKKTHHPVGRQYNAAPAAATFRHALCAADKLKEGCGNAQRSSFSPESKQARKRKAINNKENLINYVNIYPSLRIFPECAQGCCTAKYKHTQTSGYTHTRRGLGLFAWRSLRKLSPLPCWTGGTHLRCKAPKHAMHTYPQPSRG